MVIEQFAVLAGFMLAGGVGGVMLSRILRRRTATVTVAEPPKDVETMAAPIVEEEPPVAHAAGPAEDGGELTDTEPEDEPLPAPDEDPQVDAKNDGEAEKQNPDTAETLARMEYLLNHIAEAQLALNEHVISGGGDDRLANRIAEVSGTVRAISEMLVVMSAKLDGLSDAATAPSDDDVQISNAEGDDDVDLIAASEVDDTDSASGDHADEPPTQTAQSGDSAEVAILCQFPTVIPVHMGNAGSTVGDCY